MFFWDWRYWERAPSPLFWQSESGSVSGFWMNAEGFFGAGTLLPGLIITAAVSIPWFWLAFRQNGYAFISTFFINHNLARYRHGHPSSLAALLLLPAGSVGTALSLERLAAVLLLRNPP